MDLGYVPPVPPDWEPPEPDAGRMLREGIRRARITRLHRIVAHVSLMLWPTLWAMRLLDYADRPDDAAS